MENLKILIEDFNPNGLKQEIALIKNEEMEKKKNNPRDYNPHFDDIVPGDLKEEDLYIYYCFKKYILTKEQFENYRASFKEVEDIHNSRFNFMAWLANQLMKPEWLKIMQPEIYNKHFKNKERGETSDLIREVRL